jgi:hypothetical protein
VTGLAAELEGRYASRHLAHSAAALFGLFLHEMVLMNLQKVLIRVEVNLSLA